MIVRSRISRLFVAPAPVLLAIVVSACGSADEPIHASKAAPPVEWPAQIAASIAHRDSTLGTPSFVWINRSQLPHASTALESATATVRGLAKAYGLDENGLRTIASPVVHDLGSGPIVTRFTQTVDGIDVFRGGLNVVLTREHEPVAASGLVAKSFKGREKPFAMVSTAALDVAVARAATVGERAPGAFTSLGIRGGYERFAASGLSQPAMVKKVFFPEEGGLVPAWYVNMMFRKGGAWSFVVAADDGRELFRNDLVKHDFSYQVYADPQTKMPYDGPMGNGYVPHPTGRPDGLRPPLGPSQLVTLQSFPFSKNDPWLKPDATNTLGLNVWAYNDVDPPDGYVKSTNDFVATMTAAGVFGSVYDTSKSPSSNPNASVTQLFYTMNFMHDYYYDVGFDEKSGNHQESNYGRGGVEGDPLLAEGQDWGGKNNADAATPPDGGHARVQMYVWSGISEAKLNVTKPAGIAGSKNTQIAGFGQDSFVTTGDVVVADDGTGADAKDACEPLDGVNGKIVLVHRGTCSFVQKALNVQQAGGIGVIVANLATSMNAEQPPNMGGTSTQVNIPILSVGATDGAALEAAAAMGSTAVTVEMERKLQTDLDGSLDVSVVSHEWGHTLSNRLIGNGDGLTSNQSGGLGEGWSDFVALTVTVRGDDPGGYNGTYTNGGYATGGIADFYFGTRRVPYSTDMTKNALTLKHIQNGVPLPVGPATSFGEDGSFNAEAHSTGEVWATMLWECYAALLRSGRYPFAEAQKRMKQYLVAALKMTPIEPTVLEARDAVLAAALAADTKDYGDFWKAFAKRGAGVGAKGPGKESTDNVGVTESFDVKNHVAVGVGAVADDTISCDHDGILDPFEVGSVELDLRNDGVDPIGSATVSIEPKSPDVKVVGFQPVKLDALKPFESQKVTVPVSVTTLGATNMPIELNVVIRDDALGDTKSELVTLPVRYSSDEAPESSTSDGVDTTDTVWTAKGLDKLTKPWARVKTSTASYWSVADQPAPGDQRLTSPEFTIDGTTFTLSFKHRWSFRFSTRRMIDLDGGIVEVSTDAGKTFKDISTFGTVDYNTTIDGTRGDNPLKGMKAYGNKSMGYPDQWITSRIAVDLGAHPESVMIRFRAGMSTGFSGAPGWDVDDISLEGISSKPFPSYVPQQDQCDPAGPSVPAFTTTTVESKQPVLLTASGSHPENKPLTFLWAQESGAFVESKTDGPNLTFIAPEAKDAPIKVTFVFRAHDGSLLSAPGRVEVTVVPDPSVNDSLGGGCDCRTTSSHRAPPLGALGIAAVGVLGLVRRRRRR